MHWMNREEYTRRMQFEHELVDRRLTWLLQSETILFAAYGIALEKTPWFLKTVSIVGLTVSTAVFIGIVASLSAKYYTWQDFKKASENEKEQFWVRTGITCAGFVPDLALPLVFTGAWIYIIIQ
jgi:hypothetical protein